MPEILETNVARVALVAAVGLAVTGCTVRAPDPLRLDRVEPDAGPASAATSIRILGTFSPEVFVSFTDEERSALDVGFGASLGDAPLAEVTWIDEGTLAATVPAGLEPGLYDLEVSAPAATLQILAGAYRVLACTRDSECADPCRSTSACVDGECLLGELDLDADGDGAVDASCDGGDDCDDDPNGCGAACHPDHPDLCDGLNNDCDGSTPDGADDPSLGGACDGNDSDFCLEGVLFCDRGNVACGDFTGDTREGPACDPTCGDGIDNDCDTATDGDDPDCEGVAPLSSRTITLSSGLLGISSDQIDFPLWVNLENPSFAGSPQGWGISFWSTGGVQLDHELEAYDSDTGRLQAWVRLPLLAAASDTVFEIHYGDPCASESPENGPGVWDDEYRGVWHLGEEAAGTGNSGLYLDSTSWANHGDDEVTSTDKAGHLGAGQRLDNATDDQIIVPAAGSLNVDYLTLSLWLEVASWISDGGIVAKGANSYRQYWLWTYAGELAYEVDEAPYHNNAASPQLGVWQHVALTYDGAQVLIYLNGAEVWSFAQATGPIDPQAEPLRFGFIPGFRFGDASLDEVRISNVARSADWIRASFVTQSDPGVIALGPETAL